MHDRLSLPSSLTRVSTFPALSVFRSPCVHHSFTMRPPCVHHAFTMRSPCVHHASTTRPPCVHHASTICPGGVHHASTIRSPRIYFSRHPSPTFHQVSRYCTCSSAHVHLATRCDQVVCVVLQVFRGITVRPLFLPTAEKSRISSRSRCCLMQSFSWPGNPVFPLRLEIGRSPGAYMLAARAESLKQRNVAIRHAYFVVKQR